jgi:tRNA (guanine10-N2)-methyltransferase
MLNLNSQEVYSSETIYEWTNLQSQNNNHFLIVQFPNEEVVLQICSRSVLIKSIHELWATGENLEEVVNKIKNLSTTEFLNEYMNNPTYSWSIQFDTFCRTFTMEQKQECRLNFNFLNFPGVVNLKNPLLELWIILDFSKHKNTNISKLPIVPSYFGRLISRGGLREEFKKYTLKKRIYLGPTSLDEQLTFILSNIAKVKKGMLVYDPFVGTASILIALSHFGAKCFGFSFFFYCLTVFY